MGYCPDWQRQNMKKTGQSGPTTTPSRKDMGSLFHSAPVAQNKSMTKPMHLADGDTEETYKARGMEASSGDKVGFFERLRMGNIDEPGSEAYNRFGAGRGREVEAETTRIANRAAAAASSRVDDTPAPSASPDPEPVASAPRMTAADFQRGDKDTTPVSMPRTRRASSSVSGSATKAAAPAKAEPARAPVESVVKVKKAEPRGAEFDPNRIDNFTSASSSTRAKEQEKPASKPITRSRAYYSGRAG